MAREPLVIPVETDAAFQLIEADLSPPGRVEPVLRGVSLRLGRGEIGVLCGANGSGKTTLLRTAAGLWPLRAGRMHPPAPQAFDLRRAALLVEDPSSQFTTGSVGGEIEFALENLNLAPEAIEGRREEVLTSLGIARMVSRDPATLSPGEQEKALVAAALAAMPPVLLMDDPFLYLGAWESRRLWAWTVAAVRQGRIGAVLLATHDPEPSLDADFLGILAEGRLAAWGVPRDLWAGPIPDGLERPVFEERFPPRVE